MGWADQAFIITGPVPITNTGRITGNNYITDNQGSKFYSGVPAAGDLIASIVAADGFDSFGNAVFAGVQSYGAAASTGSRNPATGATALLTNAELVFAIGLIFTLSATLSAQQQAFSSQARPTMQAVAPKQAGSLDSAVLSLLGGDTGGVNHGMALLALSAATAPLTTSLLEVQGTVAMAESSTPATPTGAGVLFVDGTGHLRYLGPAGTNTLLANP